MKKIKFLLGLVLFPILLNTNLLNASLSDIPVTRDIESDKHHVPNYEDYLQNQTYEPTEFKEIYRTDFRNENFLVIVQTDLYPLIEDALTIYFEDLLNEELNSILVTFSGTSEIDLKNLIIDYYQNDDIVGTILIGNLPAAWYEMYNDFNDDGEPDGDLVEFPIDLYFADMDGNWNDTDQNGKFDVHWGEVHPEIWMGRIKADNLTYTDYNESELINHYFTRNHLFRSGILAASNNALAYIEDDWSYWGNYYQECLEFVYPEVELVNDINETNAQDYRDYRLTADYEFIQVHVHSWHASHFFYENNGQTYNQVYNYELNPINPTALFYNLFACSNAHFEAENNMGSLYLLANDFCLGTIGSTKSGSMLRFENFYEPLSYENTFGESMKQWWTYSVDTGQSQGWERSWFYGMVFLGDPTLKQNYENISPPANLNISVESDLIHLEWDEIPSMDPSAISYNIYSSLDPFANLENWILEQSGITETQWSEPVSNEKKFYFVTAAN